MILIWSQNINWFFQIKNFFSWNNYLFNPSNDWVWIFEMKTKEIWFVKYRKRKFIHLNCLIMRLMGNNCWKRSEMTIFLKMWMLFQIFHLLIFSNLIVVSWCFLSFFLTLVISEMKILIFKKFKKYFSKWIFYFFVFFIIS